MEVKTRYIRFLMAIRSTGTGDGDKVDMLLSDRVSSRALFLPLKYDL